MSDKYRLLRINEIIRQAEEKKLPWKQAILEIKSIMPCDKLIKGR